MGPQSIIRAGACVKQRSQFGNRTVLDGFPAAQVGTLDAAPPRPAWAFDPEDLPALVPTAR